MDERQILFLWFIIKPQKYINLYTHQHIRDCLMESSPASLNSISKKFYLFLNPFLRTVYFCPLSVDLLRMLILNIFIFFIEKEHHSSNIYRIFFPPAYYLMLKCFNKKIFFKFCANLLCLAF